MNIIIDKKENLRYHIEKALKPNNGMCYSKGNIIMPDEMIITKLPKEAKITYTKSPVVLRDISKEQAKREIIELLTSSSTTFDFDYGEIAAELKLDIKLVAQACDELDEELLFPDDKDVIEYINELTQKTVAEKKRGEKFYSLEELQKEILGN